MSQVIIDVREKDEFEKERVEDSIHIPLSDFASRAPALLRCLGNHEITLLCQGGKRAQLAADQAACMHLSNSLKVFPGGLNEWKRQGLPTVRGVKRGAGLPIMRQVQLIAGSLVFGSVLLSHYAHPNFICLAGFVGAGLMFAGLSGFCGMAVLLSKAPWNSTKS